MDMGMFRAAFSFGSGMRKATHRRLFRLGVLDGCKTSRHIQAPPTTLPLFSGEAGAAGT